MGGCQGRQDIDSRELNNEVFNQLKIDEENGMKKQRETSKDISRKTLEDDETQLSITSFPSGLRKKESIISEITREAEKEFNRVATSQSWNLSKKKKKKKSRTKKDSGRASSKKDNPFRDSHQRKINMREIGSDDEEIYGGLLLEASRSYIKSISAMKNADEFGSNV